MFLVSSCSCLRSIHWSHVLSWEWRCSWSSADRRCSNYIWMINHFIACWGATYTRGFTVTTIWSQRYSMAFISGLLSHLQNIPPIVPNINPSVPFMREPKNQLQYSTWNMAWHCLKFAKFRPERHFNWWDFSEYNPIHPFSWPTNLTYDESAHLKLHDMYLKDNSLPKYIQTTSRNWNHMFRKKCSRCYPFWSQ